MPEKEALYEVANGMLGSTTLEEARSDGYDTLLKNIQDLLKLHYFNEDPPYTAKEIADYIWSA